MNASSVVSLPASVDQPPGEAVEVLNLSTSAEASVVGNASFQVRVSSAAVSGTANVTVYRYHEAEWNRLETTVVRETETEVVLRAETPGFSYFAVSSRERGEQTATDTTQTTTSGGTGDTSTETEGGRTTSEQPTSESDTEPSGSTEPTTTGAPGFTVSAAVGAVVSFVLLGYRRRE